MFEFVIDFVLEIEIDHYSYQLIYHLKINLNYLFLKDFEAILFLIIFFIAYFFLFFLSPIYYIIILGIY